MNDIKTDIIPINQQFHKIDAPKELDLKAICCFMATGFFLEKDTYWKNKKVLTPAANHVFDSDGNLINSESYFKWHYTPRDLTFDQALDEFEVLFDAVICEQTKDKKVILPISGGIDSRTQAVALMNHPNIQSYSYRFKGGYPEDKIGEQIAIELSFPFTKLEIKPNYLWGCIEDLARINQCYSDFTNPRQMAFINEYAQMGTIFSLGHWGDVLFDRMTDTTLSDEQELQWVLKKTVKKGGFELANNLWKAWKLEGDFKNHFESRLKLMLTTIEIENSSAKLRAFKSKYWAPRWTSVGLRVFESVAPITLPYYDNSICEFICTIPEEYLADRKLQRAYIQRKSMKVAGITWHGQKPFNLNNYQFNKAPYNLPYRVLNKTKRTINRFFGKPHVSRNWELQFLGKENDKQLKKWLFDSGLDSLVPKELVQEFYNNFQQKDAVEYAHTVSMLLTLALFNKKFNK